LSIVKHHDQKVPCSVMVAQFLKATSKGIGRERDRWADEFEDWQAEFELLYDKAVADEIETLWSVYHLSLSDTQRIWPAIDDAARCYYSVHWWPIFTEATERHFRIISALSAVVLLSLGGVLYLMPEPHAAHLVADDASWPLLTALILFAVGAVFQLLIPYRYRTAIWIAEAVAAIAAVAEFQRWSPQVLSTWKTLISSLSWVNPQVRQQMAAAPVAEIVDLTLWLLAIFCIAMIMRRGVNFWVKGLVSKRRYGRPAEQCAELMIGFLEINCLIAGILDRMELVAADDKGDTKAFRIAELPPASFRNEINHDIKIHLRWLASRARKPWRQAMRSRNGSAGRWVSGQASRIEFFIRLQQSKNMLFGNNLVELRNAMVCALIQAADGDWHLIGSEPEYSHAALVGRWKVIIRRSLAIALPILVAVAATRFLRTPYVQAVVLTCLGFTAMQLLGFLDPDAPARLDAAGRFVANALKR